MNTTSNGATDPVLDRIAKIRRVVKAGDWPWATDALWLCDELTASRERERELESQLNEERAQTTQAAAAYAGYVEGRLLKQREELTKARQLLERRHPIVLGPVSWAVVGSREFAHKVLVERILDLLIDPGDSIVSGGARGPDTWAEEYADERGMKTDIKRVTKEDWRQGKHVALERNTDIVAASDAVIAFWDGYSRGTQDTVRKARKAGKLTIVVTK